MVNSNPQSPIPSPKKLYLIDGSGFIFRAYHALPPMNDPQGTPVNAVYGFTNMLLKLMETVHSPRLRGEQEGGGDTTPPSPSAARHPLPKGEGIYMAVIFDAGRKTFRNDMYAEYKANRPPPPDDLIPQFALVRDATKALSLPAIELADFEADDIIATYARKAQKEGMEVIIVSSDKDLMQLVGGGISMYDAMKQKTIGEAEVREKFGVGPDKVREVLSLIGDSSDNVPGVPGIGPKTAAELINEYGDLETLLAKAGSIKQPKRRESLIANADKARLSHRLIALKEDVDLPPISELAARPADPQKLAAFLQSHGFKSLAARLGQKSAEFRVQSAEKLPAPAPGTQHSAPLEKKYTLVQDEKILAEWIKKATAAGAVAFDTETTSLDALQAELVGFSLSCAEGEACYVPVGHKVTDDRNQITEREGDLFSLTFDICHLAPGQIPLTKALEMMKPLLEDEAVVKIGHNIKYDMLVMGNYGVEITPVEDTMLLSYVLHAGEHGQGMDELAERYLGYKTITFDEVTGTGKNRLRFDQVEMEKARDYAAEDADITLRLYRFFKPQLAAARLLSVYDAIERPLVPVLLHMEREGIKVDTKQLVGLSRDFSARMGELEKNIHTMAGHAFNVGSPKQLGEVLFEEMQLVGGRKSSKTGAWSTGNEVLEDLAEQGHAIAERVIAWRQLSKLKSTYSDSLPQQINPKTGRVHTSFAQAIASTGRLSSSDPNLQNIPIRTEEGRKIRAAFIAEEGSVLMSADYSQIELRLLAHIADIPTLKTAFKNGDDIHAITASQMFGVPVDKVDADLRRSAKTINFGIIYGISAHGLASRLGIERGAAAEYIGEYFKQYPGIRDYMETTKEFAHAHGYVETLFKRRCHVPGINDKGARRQFFERAAINAPLQGTAADIIKKAMIAIDKGIRHSGLGISEEKIHASPNAQSPMPNPSLRMLLQVHDELVFEVKEKDVAEAEKMVKYHMEHAAELSVPLIVETGHGRHWGEAH